jgi:hypothetical protein
MRADTAAWYFHFGVRKLLFSRSTNDMKVNFFYFEMPRGFKLGEELCILVGN